MATPLARHSEHDLELLEQRNDPFYLGTRYVKRMLPDGQEVYDEVPLTVEDLIHPQEGDVPVQSVQHQGVCRYLAGAFEAQLVDEPGGLVLHDVGIVWDVPGLKTHAPDISVIFNAQPGQRGTFVVAEEGTRPVLIVEVTSPATASGDYTIKLEEYAQAGVQYYVILHSYQREGRVAWAILGHELTTTGYALLPLDDEGRLWVPPVRLWLADVAGEIVCFTASGERIGTVASERRARRAAEAARRREAAARAGAEARAQEEAAARAELEARLAEAEAALRRLRGE